MRTIKFKVYYEKHKRWEFYTLGDLVTGATSTENGEGGYFSNWCEWTGLLDKNGKEIYEGDIMLVLDRDWPSGDYTNQTPQEYMRKIAKRCEVVFERGSFWLKNYGDINREYGRDIFEIIGNIYENPELLT